MRKFLLVVAAILGFILIAAATLYLLARPLPSALLTDSTCDPPCWLGIRPGETTPWRVSQALLEARFVDQPSIQQWEDGQHTDRITWRFRRPAGDLAGFVYFDDELVSHLRILTLGTMTLGDALHKYGDPDAFWLEERDRATEAWAELHILYAEIGCVLEIRFDYTGQPAPKSVATSENTPVRAVVYFDPSAIRTLFPTAMEWLQEGHGLGEVELSTPPE